MHSLSQTAVVAAVALAGLSSAARTIKIENRCSTKVWPAVSPFADNEEPYGDSRGWEMKPGSQKSITVSNSFHGRIWGRQGCVAQTDGTIICVTGACPGNKLECDDGALGTGTNLDLRLSAQLNGQQDWYMLTNGGGWSMPTAVKSTCETISCTPDLDACPDDQLKLQDSYGVTLGCMSSCYANIGDPAVQCCSGDYQNPKSCTPDLIQFYSYFKSKSCQHAYAYFQDSRSGQPQVDYLCPSDGEPGYVFTFCPDGDDGAGGKTTAKTKNDAKGETQTAVEDSQPTGTGGGSQPTDVPAITSIASLNATVAESSHSETASSTSASASGSSGSTAASGTSSGSAPSSSASSGSSTAGADEESADATEEEGMGGLTTTQLYWIAGGGAVLALVVVGLIIFVVRRKNKQQAQAAQQAADMEQAQAAGSTAAQAGTGRNPAQYAPVRSRSNRSQTALLSDSDQHTDSDAPTSSDDEDDHQQPVKRRGSTASRGSRR